MLKFGVPVQNLNLDLFTMINATSNTALWLIDWGRFLSWWPQLIAVCGLLILILRKKDDLADGILPVIATIGIATVLNHLVAWIYPLVTPSDISIGFSWMHGASLGRWMGPYPIFLLTLTFACIVWFRSYLFSISLFVLGMANAWGVVFVGNYFPSQILLGMFIGVFSTLVIFLFVRGQRKLRYYIFSSQGKLSGLS
ncbi:hypothetical protein [uncultured Kiloniella sp.]|uniref:hypothetical protein n=1 Tax=uncultured Kiloniella sp. TaxID=1133091 RepID=UPI00260AEDD5|nr:hypothetical protein [uncultured Kiloniella sp.]